MTELEQQLLTSEIGSAEARLRVRTNSYIDAGRWWRRTPLWLCIYEDELVVFAVARRRYIQRVSLSDCSASSYCHATGELVIAPTEALTFNRLGMSPIQALDALRLLGVRELSVISDQSSVVSEDEVISDQSSGSRLNTIAEVVSEDKEEVSSSCLAEAASSCTKEEPVPATGPVAADESTSGPGSTTAAATRDVEGKADDDAAAAEVAALLASEEFTDAFTEEELEEFKKMTPAELLAMLEEDDEDYEDDDEEEEDQ